MRGAATPLRAAARRPAGGVARSLHTAPGMLVARALPAGLGASSKMYTLFPDGPSPRLCALRVFAVDSGAVSRRRVHFTPVDGVARQTPELRTRAPGISSVRSSEPSLQVAPHPSRLKP